MIIIGSAGVLAPGKWRWLRAIAWLAALTVAVVLAYNAVARAGLWALVELGGGTWTTATRRRTSTSSCRRLPAA